MTAAASRAVVVVLLATALIAALPPGLSPAGTAEAYCIHVDEGLPCVNPCSTVSGVLRDLGQRGLACPR
jgi:hypothetical protein